MRRKQFLQFILLLIVGNVAEHDSANSSTETTSENEYFEAQMNSCYQLSEIKCCDETSDSQFPAGSLQQCEEYCQYSDDCNFLAYDSQTLQCSMMYTPVFLSRDNSPALGNSSCIMAVKRLLNYRGPIIETIEEGLEKGKGKHPVLEVLIMKGSTGKCLGVGEKNALEWGACLKTSLWNVRWKDFINVIIKHIESGQCIHVLRYASQSVASLVNCTSAVYPYLEMIPKWTTPPDTTSKYWSFDLRKAGNIIKFLQDLTFDTLEQYKGPCDKDMKIENATIWTKTLAPFFLPGSNITVACNPDYEAREHNNTTTYQFTCLNSFMELQPCQEIETNRNSACFAAKTSRICFLPVLYFVFAILNYMG